MRGSASGDTAEDTVDFDDPDDPVYDFDSKETYICKDFDINTDDFIENTEKFSIELGSQTADTYLKSPNVAFVYIIDETRE